MKIVKKSTMTTAVVLAMAAMPLSTVPTAIGIEFELTLDDFGLTIDNQIGTTRWICKTIGAIVGLIIGYQLAGPTSIKCSKLHHPKIDASFVGATVGSTVGAIVGDKLSNKPITTQSVLEQVVPTVSALAGHMTSSYFPKAHSYIPAPNDLAHAGTIAVSALYGNRDKAMVATGKLVGDTLSQTLKAKNGTPLFGRRLGENCGAAAACHFVNKNPTLRDQYLKQATVVILVAQPVVVKAIAAARNLGPTIINDNKLKRSIISYVGSSLLADAVMTGVSDRK
jgi:hypothetical protein